ncbi:MAG TPA: MerR family transcriptional regulator [Gaiellaceae bacterium]|nr:MerR family transcriptional regulator [Gaiellaceae bacterium]
MAAAHLRIGELSRRSGVSPELLRAWERRYGLLRPTRSSGGLRLYSEEDVERVRRMRQHLSSGLAAAEAAVLAAGEPETERETPPLVPASALGELALALDAFDEPAAQAILDRLLAIATVDTVLLEIVLPYLRELGDRWERGEASVAQEHFASSVLRGRMLGLARGWGQGLGPVALLACLPGERHELGLMAFGLALRSRGWRIAYLGSDTPLATLEETAAALEPRLIVLSAQSDEPVRAHADALRDLGQQWPLAIGGPAAQAIGDLDIPSLALTDDPLSEAERVSETATPATN